MNTNKEAKEQFEEWWGKIYQQPRVRTAEQQEDHRKQKNISELAWLKSNFEAQKKINDQKKELDTCDLLINDIWKEWLDPHATHDESYLRIIEKVREYKEKYDEDYKKLLAGNTP